MTSHYDSLEARDPAEREAALMADLPGLIAHAQGASGWARILAGVQADAIGSRAALAQLPITRKADLQQLQSGALPFGGLNVTPAPQLAYLFMSPGPVYDAGGRDADWWRLARALHAAGVEAGQIVQNCFSYHFTPAAFMVDNACRALGCAVIPAGIGQTEMQVQAMTDLRPQAYVGTPSFLRIIVEKALAAGSDIASLQTAVVSGEALPPSLRAWLQANGVPRVFQFYACADTGLVAYESAHDGAVLPGLVVNEDMILEIVRPGTGQPLPAGEVGEVVITSFNRDYPLIRFATGDLSAIEPASLDGASPCGRTNIRIRGWLGRADQSVKVRGMFVHPAQVATIVGRHPAIAKARLVVSGKMADDVMVLHCEVADAGDDAAQLLHAEAIAASVRDVTKLRAAVVFAALDALANDGLVIEDARSYE